MEYLWHRRSVIRELYDYELRSVLQTITPTPGPTGTAQNFRAMLSYCKVNVLYQMNQNFQIASSDDKSEWEMIDIRCEFGRIRGHTETQSWDHCSELFLRRENKPGGSDLSPT